jgi:hypothetical protein
MRSVSASLLVALLACCGRVPQSQACKDFVACSFKTGTTGQFAQYEDIGSCWDTQQMADSCTAMCLSADVAFKRYGLDADAGCTFSE